MNNQQQYAVMAVVYALLAIAAPEWWAQLGFALLSNVSVILMGRHAHARR